MREQSEASTEIREYLDQLRRELRPLPTWYKNEILASVNAHLSEQGYPQELALDHLGAPHEVAAAAKSEFALLDRAKSKVSSGLLWAAVILTALFFTIGLVTAPSGFELWWGRLVPLGITLFAALTYSRHSASSWWPAALLLTFAAVQGLVSATQTGVSFPMTLFMAALDGIVVTLVTVCLLIAAAIVDRRRGRREPLPQS